MECRARGQAGKTLAASRQLFQLWPSLPQAKLAEDHVEQVFRGGLADDFAHSVRADPQIYRDEFQRFVRAQSR